MDVPLRRVDPRRGVAGGHGPGDGIAANGSLVSKGGVAVTMASLLATWRRSVGQRLTAVDVVTLLYIAVATAAVLAFSAHDHASWDLLLTAHALLVTLVLVAPLARQAGDEHERDEQRVCREQQVPAGVVVGRERQDGGGGDGDVEQRDDINGSQAL